MKNKVKKISYPSKYKELIEKYGEDKGNEEYYKFIRGSTYEKYQLKYGDDADFYWNKHVLKNKQSGVSLEKMISKYGKDEGEKKYLKWKESTKQNLEGFITRYGECEGKKRYESFKNKCLISLKTIDRKKVKNQRNLNYWLDLGYNIDDAKIKVSEIQNTSSLKSFIKKYGKDNGEKKYIEVNKFKSQTKENMIRLYGDDGEKKYNDYIIKLKYSKSLEYYINKYGEEHGEKIFKDIQKKKLNNFNKLYSLIGYEFCENIDKKINNDFNQIYYGDNEYKFFVWEDNFNIICVDLYIKDINMVIEFYGDYWHRNPQIYDINDDVVKKIHDYNKRRVDKLINKFNVSILIIWENDYRKDKLKTIDLVINEIYKIKNK